MKKPFLGSFLAALLAGLLLSLQPGLGGTGVAPGYDETAFANAMARQRGPAVGGSTARGLPQATPSPPSRITIKPAAGVTISQQRAEVEKGLSIIGAESIYFATMQSGNTALVLNGTITETRNQNFAYDPEPADLLRVVYATGEQLDYRISAFEGDYSQPDGTRFLRKDHDFRFTLSMSSGTEVSVNMRQRNGAYRNTLRGKFSDGVARYDVATETNGDILSDVDPPGVNFHSRERVRGKISGPGFEAEIDEFFRYHLVVFDNAIEDIEKTMSNRWKIDGDTYALVDSRIFRTFKNGITAELDSWQIKGRLTRNGEDIGGLGFEQMQTTIDTVLTVDGEKTVLFSDRAR
jgi:hypothetical protein